MLALTPRHLEVLRARPPADPAAVAVVQPPQAKLNSTIAPAVAASLDGSIAHSDGRVDRVRRSRQEAPVP